MKCKRKECKNKAMTSHAAHCPGCNYTFKSKDEIEDNGYCGICNGAESYGTGHNY